jgi:Spy/CpxP family protein refolding chaperone
MRLLQTALLLTLLLVAGAAATPLAAQTPPAAPADSLFAGLFPPELIMQHRRAIELTDVQRDEISRLIQQLQTRMVDLQWDLQEQVEELNQALAAPVVDLDRALDQMDDVLGLETEIKTAHLEMLVRIKNVLRPEQQVELRRLRVMSP